MLDFKFIPLIVGLVLTVESRSAEDIPLKWDVEIPVPITAGKPSPPAPIPEPIDFKVQSSQTQRVDVTDAPEMSGLPPIKGTINVTVQRVDDPGLPEPPPPLPALPPTDPAVIARIAEIRRTYRGRKLVFLSATVYDHSRTLLRIYPNGKPEGEITAWSNIDLNHFCGFTTYRVKESDGTFTEHDLLMGIGNIDILRMRKGFAKRGQDFAGPEMPELPDLAVGGPAFVVVAGETTGAAMDTLGQIHDLYRKEGVKLEAAFHAREKAYAARKAYLLANPPVPEDIVIQIWKRDIPPAVKAGTASKQGGVR